MELIYIAAIAALSAVFSGIFSFFWRFMLDIRRDSRMKAVEDELDLINDKMKSQYMVEKKAEYKEEKAAFMAQAGAILQGEGDMKDKIAKVVALNPELAMKMASKFGLKL